MSAPRTVVITRERNDALRWVEPLQAAGHEVLRVPWLDLIDLPDADVLAPSLPWEKYHAVLCVSAKAARVLGRPSLGWGAALIDLWAQGAGPRVWAPGPGTMKQLLALGVPSHCIDTPDPQAAQFDSEHLWQAVASQVHSGAEVLIVRGDGADANPDPNRPSDAASSGRDVIRERCEALGAHVGECVVYRRGVPVWSPRELADWQRALAMPEAVWLASSSTALHVGQDLALQHGQKPDWCHSRTVLATHPRIQATALDIGWGQVALSRPDHASVLAFLQANRAR